MVEINHILKRLENIESLLLSKKDVFNINELVSYTGLSKSTIYKLTSNSKIPFFRPLGKKLFFSKSDIDNWLLNNRNASNYEIEEHIEKYSNKYKNK